VDRQGFAPWFAIAGLVRHKGALTLARTALLQSARQERRRLPAVALLLFQTFQKGLHLFQGLQVAMALGDG